MPSIIDMPAATHLTIAVYLDLACAYYAYTSPFIHASLQPRLEWGQAETVRRNYERPRFHEAAVFDCVRLLGKYGLYFRGEHEYDSDDECSRKVSCTSGLLPPAEGVVMAKSRALQQPRSTVHDRLRVRLGLPTISTSIAHVTSTTRTTNDSTTINDSELLDEELEALNDNT